MLCNKCGHAKDECECDEWGEVEKMGPSGSELIGLAKKFPAPAGGWDAPPTPNPCPHCGREIPARTAR